MKKKKQKHGGWAAQLFLSDNPEKAGTAGR